MKNRGNDALDVLDIGVTASKDPKFALYASDFSIIAIGYSNVDGTLVGIGGREVGAMPVRQHAGAVLLYGYERFGYEDFNMADPDSPEMWRVGLFGLFAPVLTSTLTAISYAAGIQCPPDNMIADAGQVFDTATPNQDYRVLLQLMPLTRNISSYLHLVAQPYPGYLA